MSKEQDKPEVKESVVTAQQIGDAYLAVKTARRMGDRLRIELAEQALDDLLDRFTCYT